MRFSNQLKLILPVVGLLVPVRGQADGTLYSYRADSSSNRRIAPKEQVAAIVHRQGVEKMIIAINFETQAEDSALWIFPVPGTPQQTRVDVLDAFPRFGGQDPRRDAAWTISSLTFLQSLSQIWPLLPLLPFTIAIPNLGPSGRGVSVYGKIDKWGVHAETIMVETLDGLADYLRERKAGITKEQLSVFQPYVSNRFVLVVVWLASAAELLKEFPDYKEQYSLGYGRWPCLYVQFATQQPFYPLRPTSAYGSTTVPVRLIVLGFVKPETSPSLSQLLQVSHYVQGGFSEGTPKVFTEGVPAEKIPYSLIRIVAPADAFTEDLRFSPVQPEGMRYADFVTSSDSHFFAVEVAAFLTLSYLAAGLSALWLLRKWKGYAKFGLWNGLTLIGLYLAIRYLPGERAATLRQEKRFVMLFSLMFLSLTMLQCTVLLIPLHSASFLGGLFFFVVSGIFTVGARYSKGTLLGTEITLWPKGGLSIFGVRVGKGSQGPRQSVRGHASLPLPPAASQPECRSPGTSVKVSAVGGDLNREGGHGCTQNQGRAYGRGLLPPGAKI